MELEITEKVPLDILEKQVLDIQEKEGFTGQGKNRLVVVYDISPSTEFPHRKFYTSGIMAGLTRRLVAVAMTLDDDGQVPVYLLDKGVRPLKVLLTRDNCDDYIEKQVMSYVRLGDSTNYAPTINRIVQDMGPGDPVLVIFCTDGEAYDTDEATVAIQKASYYPIFFQFMGMEGKVSGEEKFDYLNKLDELEGRFIDNAGFSRVPFYGLKNEALFQMVMHEYAGYPDKARKAGLLPWTQKEMVQPTQPRRGLFGR